MSKYEVEKILNDKVDNGITYYRIKWKGYSLFHSTWETEDNILENCSDLIDKYKSNKSAKNSKRKRLCKESNQNKCSTELSPDNIDNNQKAEDDLLYDAIRLENIRLMKEDLSLLSAPYEESNEEECDIKSVEILKSNGETYLVLSCTDEVTNDTIIQLVTIELAPKKYLRRILQLVMLA